MIHISPEYKTILQLLAQNQGSFVNAEEVADVLVCSKTKAKVLSEALVKQGFAKQSAHAVKAQYMITQAGLNILQEDQMPSEKQPESKPQTAETVGRVSNTPQQTAETKPKRQAVKPYTPNPTRGYEVQKGKVKIYLDRKAASRVLTLSIDDLKELVRAVEKAA